MPIPVQQSSMLEAPLVPYGKEVDVHEFPVRILLIEDDEDDYVLVRDRLFDIGESAYEVQWVNSAEAALATVTRHEYDVLLVDYRLGPESGLELLARIQAEGITTPAIMLTGQGDREVDLAAMQAGAADFLVKGHMEGSLLERAIRYALERGAAMESLQYRVKLELLIARISTHFVRLHAREIDPAIEWALEETGLFVGVERSFSYLLDSSREHIIEGHAWRAHDSMVQPPRLPAIPIESIPWVMGRIGAFQSIIVPRVSDLPPEAKQIRQVLSDLGACSALIVPMVSSGQLIGALGLLCFREEKHWSDDNVSLLRMVGEILASALARKQAEEAIQRQVQRLEALRTIDAAIMSSTDLALTLDIILGQAITLLGVDAALVLLMDPNSLRLDFAAGRGTYPVTARHYRLRVGEGYAGRVALNRRMIRLPDPTVPADRIDPASTLSQSFEARSGAPLSSYFGVPLIAKGEVQGVLELMHREPIEPDADWLDFLEALAGQTAIAIDNARLFHGLQRSNLHLARAYDTTLEGWSRALDLRDKETEGHSQRVTDMTVRLARAVGMRETELVQVRRGALLHDIGKMGVPDSILLKPGPLTDEEWEIMRRHPIYAFELLAPIEFLRPALDIPYCHHEKWDGTGYPRGLEGEQIPLGARVFAVIDIWDALRSDRPYRAAWPDEKVRDYLRSIAGSHLDPMLVDTFLTMLDAEKL